MTLNLSCQNKATPKEYLDYKTLEEGVYSQNYKAELLFHVYNGGMECCYPKVYKTFNNNVLILFKKENNPYETYYKFDNNGQIKDTLSNLSRIVKNDNSQFPSTEFFYEFINGFLVEKEYYSTWAIDGDTTKKPLKILNENSDWNNEQLTKELSEIIKNSLFFVQRNSKVYFYADKILGVINTKGFYDRLKYATSDNNPFDEKTFIGSFSFDYFHKKKRISYTTSIGGGNGRNKNKGDYGDLFVSMNINEDKLKIKFEDLILGSEHQPFYRFFFEKQATDFDFVYYAYKDMNFALLSVDDRLFYIILPKG